MNKARCPDIRVQSATHDAALKTCSVRFDGRPA